MFLRVCYLVLFFWLAYFPLGACSLGFVDVFIEPDPHQNFEVFIRTPRLFIRNIEQRDLEDFACFFSDESIMCKWDDGAIKTRHHTKKHFKKWMECWQRGDPFSALAITLVEERKERREFKVIGFIMLGHCHEGGTAELTFLIEKRHWLQGFGCEAVSAVVHHFARRLHRQHFFIDNGHFNRIKARVRLDNIAAIKILQEIGMHRVNCFEKWGKDHCHFIFDFERRQDFEFRDW